MPMNSQLDRYSINFDLKQEKLWEYRFKKGTELKAYELIKKIQSVGWM